MGAELATVLVVEDDASIRFLCRVTLELQGFAVEEAAGLAEARAAIRSRPPAAVVLDLTLGGEDGGGLLEGLAGIPVVLLTGALEVPDALRLRAAAVLGKPFDPDELAVTVGRIVTGR